MTDAELRSLLVDCLDLWSVRGRVSVDDDGVVIATERGRFVVNRAEAAQRPVRWLLQKPARAADARPPRPAPSIVALLGALRHALEAELARVL